MKASGKGAYTVDKEEVARHEALHATECAEMKRAFDPVLPRGKQREEYSLERDFTSLQLSASLIGEHNNGPFESQNLIHFTNKPLFSADECNSIIAEAEGVAKKRGGWSTQRHYSHPTTDIRVQDIPQTMEWFCENLPTKLFPAIAACFPNLVKDPEGLRIFDVFVVKYNADQQSYLKVHRDSSLISVTIALNKQTEFEGGGMWVEPLDQVVNLDQGQTVTFASNIRHGGHKVTQGLRYILVGFLLYDGYVEHDRRFLESSQALRAQGKVKEAISSCNKALQVNPRRQEAWNNLGILQRDAGQYQEATTSLKKALAIDDRYVEGWSNLAVCQGLSGDKSAAIKTAKHAVSINGGDFLAHYNLACAHADNGEHELAKNEFSAAIAINSQDGETHQRRGEQSLLLGEVEEAITDYRQAVKLQGDSASALNDLGVALYEADKNEEALDAFKGAMLLDPANVEASSNAQQLAAYLQVPL